MRDGLLADVSSGLMRRARARYSSSGMTRSREPDTTPRGAFYLAPHPSTPCEAVKSIGVRLARSAGGRLDLVYAVDWDSSRVRLPAPAAPRRTDGLWRHTCFEAFVAADGEPAYVELNFAPSGEWACYSFAGYREGMTPVEDVGAPAIAIGSDIETGLPGAWTASGGERSSRAAREARWCLRAGVQLASLAAGGPARVALAAVIEEADGRLSYWALGHPPGKPDFHHPAGFMAQI